MENFPVVIQIVVLAVWMFGVPVVVGGCFWNLAQKEFGKIGPRLVFSWVAGQMLQWAAFQVVCVPMIVKEQSFHRMAAVFLFGMAVLFLGGAVVFLRHKGFRRDRGLHVVREREAAKSKDKWTAVLWGLFAVLFLLQLVLAVTMTYADGDDAYYVAMSAMTNDADTMYLKLPYTGGATGIDLRHGLAPFPMWISFLAWLSGLHTTVVAHVAVQLMLIPFAYGIFYLLGKKLLQGKGDGLPLFLVLTEILVIFGGTSIYTMEHFMLARSRQGKTVLCSIVIPLLFFLLLMLYEKLQAGEKCTFLYWMLLAAVTTASCLCSVMGAILVCMLLGIAGLCGAVCYKKWRMLVPMVLCCLPCVVFAALYFVLQ